MTRGRRVVVAVGSLALLALGAGLFTIRDEIAAWRRSLVVRGLLDPAEREETWRRVAGWQRYPTGDPDYRTEFLEDKVREVIRCPQRRGWPILAVFFAGTGDRHFELVRMDGTLIPDWMETRSPRNPITWFPSCT